MFWQLNVVYGEHFILGYIKLIVCYLRVKCLILMKRKAAIYLYDIKSGRAKFNSFFEEWGLTPNDDIREKIENQKLPKLEKEIWKATDSNDIREKQVELYKVPYGEPANEVQNL